MMRNSGPFLLLAVVALLVARAHPSAGQLPLGALAPASPLGPKTVVPATVACADLPAPAEPVPPLRVLAPHAGDGHEMTSPGDLVVLNGGTPQGLAPGQRYFARRFVPASERGAPGADLQGLVRTAGWLTVVAADEHSALARIDYACTPVAAGDYLEPYEEPALPTPLSAGPPEFGDLGRVVIGTDRRESFGAGDLLVIDRGQTRGVTPGMRVSFYRDRRNGTPLVELGTGIVVEVTADHAKVVVERAGTAVLAGDYVALSRRP